MVEFLTEGAPETRVGHGKSEFPMHVGGLELELELDELVRTSAP